MKKNILTSIGLTAFFSAAIFVATALSPNSTTSVYAKNGGSPGGRTNSPADGSNCTACHSGTMNTGNGQVSVTSTIPGSGYVPGQTYTITGSITQNSSNKFGFEITAERDANNAKVGTMTVTNSGRTKMVGGAVTHILAGTSGTGTNSWSFDWIAPSIGTGNVTLYGAFNASDALNNSGGDDIYTTTLAVSEDLATGIDAVSEAVSVSIYPNPAQNQLQINANQSISNITIYNMEGQKMLNVSEQFGIINIESLSAGIYFVHITSGESIFTQKLIKK